MAGTPSKARTDRIRAKLDRENLVKALRPKGLPDAAECRVTEVMLSKEPQAPAREAGQASASEREPGCEFPDGSPRPINRVRQPVCAPESGVSSPGDVVARSVEPIPGPDDPIVPFMNDIVVSGGHVEPNENGDYVAIVPARADFPGEGENSVEVHSSGGDASQFYTAMKEMGFSSIEEVRGYLALAREPWPELTAEELEALPKNAPRLRHEFQSGPWDPTWKWCWEQVMKYGFSPAPKRIEVDERLLVVVDYAVSP